MAKVHDMLEKWQDTQSLRATQKELPAENKQLTSVGHIFDTEEIVKPSRSNYEHYRADSFKLSETSPVPAAWSAKDLPGV